MEHLKVSKEADGRVALLTLARPERLNALSSKLLQELEQAISEAEESPNVGAVVVTGEGKAFCAGADIDEQRTIAKSEATAFSKRIQRVFNRVEECRLPVVAAVTGAALGGGFELVLSCDLVVAEEDARFGFPEIKLGVIPGAGGTQRLPRLVGRNRAKELIFFGESVSAEQVRELGVVNQVVSETESLDTALQWGAALAEGPPLALGVAKRAINQGIQADLTTGLELEAQGVAALFGTRDQIEGMNAFLEKREVRFTGE